MSRVTRARAVESRSGRNQGTAPEGGAGAAEGESPDVEALEADGSRLIEEDGGDILVTPSRELPLGRRHRFRAFFRRVYEKAGEDNIFFLAGAISFNVLVAIVPLLLFSVGVAGIVLSNRFPDPASVISTLLVTSLPVIGGDIDLIDTVRGTIDQIIEQRAGFTALGAVLLIWFSTRLVGTLRTVLREVFDIAQDRGIVGGKIFDAKVVLVGGFLFLLNIGVTAMVTAAQQYGVEILGLEERTVSVVQQSVAYLLAFGSIWMLFLGVYRFLPARWIPWRTAFIAATFAAVFHELLKWAFGWYVTDVASYRSTYGNLVTLAILFLWIYYEAVVFILGGEIAQVWTMRRARRVKTRDALFGAQGRRRKRARKAPQEGS